VTGARVNVRSGPGTQYAVLSTLSRGDQAELLSQNGRGWARVRARDTGQVGWMAARFLTAAGE